MYVLLLDEILGQARADQIVAAVLIAAGNDVEMPPVLEARQRFDEYLASEPDSPADSEMHEQLKLLGLRK